MDLLFGKERKTIESEPRGKSTDNLILLNNDVSYSLNNQYDVFSTRLGYNPHEYRWGDGTVSILDFYLAADGEPYPTAVTTGQTICLAVSVKFHNSLTRPILGITIKTKEGVTVYGVNSETLACDEFQLLGQKSTVVQAEANFKCSLAPGDYFVSLGIATRNGEEVIPHDRRYDSIHLQVRPHSGFFGLVDLGLNLSAKTIE